MKAIFMYVVLAILMVSVGLYLHISKNRVSESTPTQNLSISTKQYNSDIYFQVASGEPDAIQTIRVTKDEPQVLELRLVFTYDGKEGARVSTCGGVIKEDRGYSKEWGCRPTRVTQGQNTVLYRFELLDDQADDFYCTDTVRVNIYKDGGMDFFNQLFEYKKTWVYGSGFIAQLKQFAYGYIKCS